MNYFIAPRSGERSYKNYLSTIKHGVPFKQIEPHLTEEGKNILSNQDVIYGWGNRASKKAEWERMVIGDTIIFYAHKHLVMAGRVVYKQHSKDLALAMWPPDEHGNPWEYTFFVSELRYFKIPLQYFNYVSGYNLTAVMGFLQVSEVRMRDIVRNCGSFEKLFDQFSDEVSVEIPNVEENLYVNVNPKTQPEFSSAFTEAYVPEVSQTSTKRTGYIDFETVHRNHAFTGSRGEEIVLENEKKHLVTIGRVDLAEKVKRISLEDTYAGYDILSFDDQGAEKRIEVKSTTGSLGNKFSFNVSKNEINVANSCDNFYVYLVFKANSENPIIRAIKNPFKNNSMHLEAKTYVAKGKFIE